ncbi:MAG TPA: acyltransferase family protein, partial [Rhizobiaceae bacterium]|nr:acyltransferase family protein [Rhizobiaceae bacterium]
VHFFDFYLLWMTIQFVIKTPAWAAEGLPLADIARLYLVSFIDPFGTLWFIYILPVFFIVARLLKNLPWQLTLGVAALLEIAPIHTGWMIPDEFAARYVYFLAGYLFAANIFTLADWAKANVGSALALLAAWFAVNGWATFTPAQLPQWANVSGPLFVSDLPIVSLALGAAGGAAVVVLTALLSMVPAMRFLGYLGKNSIVVYLAFFLPLAVMRGVLLKFAPMLDIGTVALLVTIAGVCGPVILKLAIDRTGFGNFLFERPQWARIEPVSGAAKARLSPAE